MPKRNEKKETKAKEKKEKRKALDTQVEHLKI